MRYDPTRPLALSAAAADLLDGERSPEPIQPPRVRGWFAGLALTAAVLALLLAVSVAPFHHPTASQPEFVLTFRAFGDWVDATTVSAAAQDNRPVHMRAAVQVNRSRAPVVVRLVIDGGVAQEHVFRPKGLKSDGASIGELRLPLAPGPHRVSVSVATHEGANAPRTEWNGEVVAQRGRLVVLAFEPGTGFRVEP